AQTTWGAQSSLLRAPFRRFSYLGSWRNRTRFPRADELVRLLLMRRVTDFCTGRSLSAITFQIAEKNKVEYCADRKIFSWRQRAPTEADGGNSRQTKRLGVSCFPDRL